MGLASVDVKTPAEWTLRELSSLNRARNLLERKGGAIWVTVPLAAGHGCVLA